MLYIKNSHIDTQAYSKCILLCVCLTLRPPTWSTMTHLYNYWCCTTAMTRLFDDWCCTTGERHTPEVQWLTSIIIDVVLQQWLACLMIGVVLQYRWSRHAPEIQWLTCLMIGVVLQVITACTWSTHLTYLFDDWCCTTGDQDIHLRYNDSPVRWLVLYNRWLRHTHQVRRRARSQLTCVRTHRTWEQRRSASNRTRPQRPRSWRTSPDYYKIIVFFLLLFINFDVVYLSILHCEP